MVNRRSRACNSSTLDVRRSVRLRARRSFSLRLCEDGLDRLQESFELQFFRRRTWVLSHPGLGPKQQQPRLDLLSHIRETAQRTAQDGNQPLMPPFVPLPLDMNQEMKPLFQ